MPPRRRILSLITRPLTAPSAVHLAACISIRLSPSRTLCARITALISASTVYYTKLFYKLPHTYIFVKHFFQILLFTFSVFIFKFFLFQPNTYGKCCPCDYCPAGYCGCPACFLHHYSDGKRRNSTSQISNRI